MPEEMLKIFSFLGEAKAEEIVVTNSNAIADMCDIIKPCGETKKNYPYVDNQDDLLKNICERELKKKYNFVPIKVKNRVKWELNAIEKTKSAFMFLQLKWVIDKLKFKSFEMSSRGMVGSSMVAYLCGITDMDPIDNDTSPFFFFGLFGDRTPDIDLNFSTKSAAKVKKLLENAPGVGKVIRAGILCVLSNNAIIDLIKDYEEPIADDEIEKIISLLKNTVKSKGRHPGGILILPKGFDINEVCPVSTINSGKDTVLISAFDYHSIDAMLYKLDIFAHSSMDILYKLYEAVNADSSIINLEDCKTFSIFKERYNDIPRCAGIPEFSSEFAFELLKKTEPKRFEDLIKISGLMHGTGTWYGNAEKILNEEDVKISCIPSNRSDIYDTLVIYGIDRNEAFLIADEVRKGKIKRGRSRHWFDWKLMMYKKKIPGWFIRFCENAEYLFPRSHVYSYVKASWRIAWYKTHYPIHYFCVMLNERYKNGFNPTEMAMGEEKLHAFINKLRSTGQSEYEDIDNIKQTCYFLNDFYKYGFEFVKLEQQSPDEPAFEIINNHTIGYKMP